MYLVTIEHTRTQVRKAGWTLYRQRPACCRNIGIHVYTSISSVGLLIIIISNPSDQNFNIAFFFPLWFGLGPTTSFLSVRCPNLHPQPQLGSWDKKISFWERFLLSDNKRLGIRNWVCWWHCTSHLPRPHNLRLVSYDLLPLLFNCRSLTRLWSTSDLPFAFYT